jgi:hypothetical protein
MRVFGPQYPPRLQDAVNHAERLCGVIARVEGERASDLGRAWLVGRSEEIETVLSLVVGDWRDARCSEDAAVTAVREYVDELHGAVRKFFGLDAVLDCCFGDAVATVPLPNDEETRHVLLPEEPPSDTVADLLALVKWLPRKP